MAAECPECGAPQSGTERTCHYCGAPIDRPAAPTPPGPLGLEWATPQARRRRRSGPSGCLIAFGLVAAVGVGIVALLVVVSGGGGKGGIPRIGGPNARVNPAERAVLLPTDGTGAPDAVVVSQVFDGSSSGVGLAYVEGSTGKLRWTVALDKSKGREAVVAGDGQAVYIFDGTGAVFSADRRTGTERWRAQAAFPPPPACDSCVVVTGGRFVVVGADGTVQAFDTSNGAQAWTSRLAEAPRTLHAVVGGVAAMGKVGDGSKGDTGVVVLGAEAGARRDIPLSCADPVFKSSVNRPGVFDPLVAIDDGRALVAYFRGCVQRIDVAAGSAAALAVLDRDATPSSVQVGRFEDQPDLVVDGATLLLGAGSVVVAVPLGGAPVTRIEVDKRYEIAPVTMRDGRLVVTASPSFARDRPEIWGIDLADKSRPANPVWRHPLVVKNVSDEWRARATPAGVTVVECNDDKDECAFRTLAVPDGRQVGTSTGGDLFTTAFLQVTQDDRFSWYTVGTRMFLVEHGSSRLLWAVGGT